MSMLAMLGTALSSAEFGVQMSSCKSEACGVRYSLHNLVNVHPTHAIAFKVAKFFYLPVFDRCRRTPHCMCAGPSDAPADPEKDGRLQTWLEGPDFAPLLVVDRADVAWRQFNNVSIDTLHFLAFFGDSRPMFSVGKSEVCDDRQCSQCCSSTLETESVRPVQH